MIQKNDNLRYRPMVPATMYDLEKGWFVVTSPATPLATVACRSESVNSSKQINAKQLCGDATPNRVAYVVQLCGAEVLFFCVDKNSFVTFEVTFGLLSVTVRLNDGIVTISSNGESWSNAVEGARAETLEEFATTAARRARIAQAPAEL